jgi:hypothetical protein
VNERVFCYLLIAAWIGLIIYGLVSMGPADCSNTQPC